VVSRAFSALCVYSKFGHHPRPPQVTFVPNVVSFASSIAERKIAHSTAESDSPTLSPPVTVKHRLVRFQEISISKRLMVMKGKTLRKGRF